MTAILDIHDLGKRYLLGASRPVGGRATESIAAALRRRRTSLIPSRDPLWALRDVTLALAEGDVLGVIGRNGAGKSTLLKILSRVTRPTTGSVRIRGRVASLLEVGSGFHPELTGGENVFLNGAILGMSRREIRSRFADIVDFAELHHLIDTPVKRYSSGQYTRLAFAVAAHLEAEFLLIDEVLAVGDFRFQERCLGKVRELSTSGRTIIFVSHNLSSIARLSSRCVWLEQGQVAADGSPSDVVRSYLISAETGRREVTLYQKPGAPAVTIGEVVVRNAQGVIAHELSCDDPFSIDFSVTFSERLSGAHVAVTLQTPDGLAALQSDITDTDPAASERITVGEQHFSLSFPPRLLADGRYLVHVGVASMYEGMVASGHALASFRLRELAAPYGSNRPGFFSTLIPWKHSYGPLDESL